jgi:hypothetical protein
MEAAATSETLLNFYKATRWYVPEHSHLSGAGCSWVMIVPKFEIESLPGY